MNRLCTLVGAAAVCAAACSREAVGTPRVQTLRVAYQKTTEVSSVLSEMLFADTLVGIDWRGRPTLQLGSDYQWSDEGRTLRFTIKPGMKFHDGVPVSPAAVAESIRQYAKDRPRWFDFLASVEEQPPDALLIHLSRPDTFMIETLANVPIFDPNNPDNGTGPFKRLKRTPTVEGIRNAQYYRGAPAIDRVQITTYDTPRAAWAAMMRGEVDMVPEVNRDSIEFLEGATRFATYSSLRPFYIPLVFNLRNPILKNVEVRRALSEAINREEVVRHAMRGHGRVADDPVWPFHWAYTTASRRDAYNPTAAAQRLNAAGFPVRAAKTPGGMPSRFQLRCLFWDKGPQYERIALLLQRQLAAVNVDLVLEATDIESVARSAKAGAFDTFMLQMASGKSFNYAYEFWHSSQPGITTSALSGYNGADAVLDRLRGAYSDAEVRVAVADLRQRFYEDVPAAFIAWIEVTRAVDARFDVGDPLDPEILANLWRWKVRPTQRLAQ
jgi:ABC-type transport system substrate-binding protein